MDHQDPNQTPIKGSAGRGRTPYNLRSRTAQFQDPQKPGSIVSSSVSSRAVSVKKKEIENERKKEITEFKKMVTNKKFEMGTAYNKVSRLEAQKSKLEKKIAEGDTSKETSDQVSKLEEEIIELQEKADNLKLEYECLLETKEDEIEVNNSKHDVRKEKCESDDEGDFDPQNLPGGETEEDSMNKVENWKVDDVFKPDEPGDADNKNEENKKENDETVSPIKTQDAVRQPPAPGISYQRALPVTHQNRTARKAFIQQPSSSNPLMIDDLTQALKNVLVGTRESREGTLKLDKDLPTFSGQPERWVTFENEFERTTKTYRCSNTVNLIRLRKALQGLASETVEHLYSNPDNVPAIMRTLKRRFGQPKQVLDALIKKVKDCPPPVIGKPKTIIKFGIAIEALVTNIEAFKKTSYFIAIDLMDIIVKKLPPELDRQWVKWVKEKQGEHTLLEFRKFFEEEMDYDFTRAETDTSAEDPSPRQRRNRHVGAAVEAKPHPNPNNSEKKIPFCQLCRVEGHHVRECKKFLKMTMQEKVDLVEKRCLCWKCLNRGHRLLQCRGKDTCQVDGCTSRNKHHTLLHDMPEKEESTTTESANKEDKPAAVKKVGYVRHKEDLLWYVPVKVRGVQGQTKTIYAMIDTGAQPTLIEEWLAEEMGFQGPAETIQLEWYDGQTHTETSMKVKFEIAWDFRNAKFYPLEDVNTVKQLDFPSQSYNVNELKQEYPYLYGAPLQSMENAKPAILIGARNWCLSVTRQILERDSDSPAAVKTRLGWTVIGPGGNSRTANKAFHSVLGAMHFKNEETSAIMKSFIEEDNFGIVKKVEEPRSQEDKKALQILEKTSKKEDNRWTTGLLWKQEDIPFPESKTMALKRLLMIERKADKSPEYAQLLTSRFEEYIEKGYIRKSDISAGDMKKNVPKNENDRRWYLPYFFALHPEKKPRLVFDAAAKSRGYSFNDFLLTGPDLLQPLASVLMRFRRHQIAVSGDITAMFHQVKLKEEDQPAQTILYRGMDREKEPDSYQMTVLFFGSASSPTSAIYCKDRNAKEYEEKYPVSVNAIIRDTYMDDFLSGAETAEEAIKLQKEVTEIHDGGGFPIGKWRSSSIEVMKEIPVELRAIGDQPLSSKDDLGVEKTLGIIWDQIEDKFKFNVNLRKIPPDVKDGKRNPTKRELASFLMSIFDPLGFITPLKVKGLIILQQCWKLELDWDQEVPNSVFESWKIWFEELKSIEDITIPRCYAKTSLSNAKLDLHIFCDASQEAYSAVSFLRIQTGGSVEISFVFGRGRVAPKKGLSIPRMELNAALMGARMKQTIRKYLDDLKIKEVYLWTDSRCVMCWIKSEKGRFQQYVSNRLEEILDLTLPIEWKWVPTDLNVADDATRSSKEIIMTSDSRWLKGSEFLLQEAEQWPTQEQIPAANETELEQKKIVAALTSSEALLRLPLPNADDYSSWTLLIWKTMNRIVSFRTVFQKNRGNDVLKVSSVLFTAETLWLKQVQQDSFSQEITTIQQEKQIRKNSKLFELTPVMNSEGLLVVSGRLKKAAIPETIKFPIILEGSHRYVQLLIQHIHEENHHTGLEIVINELRKKLWIVHLRTTVKKVLKDCQKCKIEKSKPVAPPMGPIPDCRLASNQPAFTHTGVDLFGPYEVAIGRRCEKRWGILFTCMTTRAVYIDLVPSLSSDDVINAITRFSARRGPPQHLYSDQGTNFKGADKELREFWKSLEESTVQQQNHKIEWHFNCPAASHMGGSWERMIGLTKKILANVMKDKKPKEYTLITFLAEAENILNCRPFHFVSEDPEDMEAITPNHLLKMHCLDLGLRKLDPSQDGRSMWRAVQRYADEFWKKWTERVLPLLNKASKWHEDASSVKTGDVVVVVDDQSPRNHWKKAVVTSVFPGKDGIVRVVEIRMPIIKEDGKVTFGVYRRPVHKVCLLDVRK